MIMIRVWVLKEVVAEAQGMSDEDLFEKEFLMAAKELFANVRKFGLKYKKHENAADVHAPTAPTAFHRWFP